MRLMLCALLAGTWLAPPASADETAPTFADIASQLAAPAVLRGNFKQSREIRLLSNPLQSTGRFILSDLGLYWEQVTPLSSIMIADDERLLQSVGDGPLQSIDVARNPLALTFSQSFLSIFEGDEAQLRENFDVQFSAGSEAETWAMTLTPITYPMSEAIESINLDGREYIETLRVTSRTSETTTITFSELQTEPGELTDHEIELYAR